MSPIARGAAAWFVVSVAACAQPYRPVLPNEPYAVVRFIRVYPETAGTLEETLAVDREPAFVARTAAPVPRTPRVDEVRVRPGYLKLYASSAFLREYVAYETTHSSTTKTLGSDVETYECGTESERRTCVRPVLRERSEPGPATTRPITKTSASESCTDDLGLHAEDGHTYLVELTYKGDGACSIACVEQTMGPDGTARSLACTSR